MPAYKQEVDKVLDQVWTQDFKNKEKKEVELTKEGKIYLKTNRKECVVGV